MDDIYIGYGAAYLVVCGAIAIWANSRVIGGAAVFFISLLLTPLAGLILTALSETVLDFKVRRLQQKTWLEDNAQILGEEGAELLKEIKG